MIFRKLIAGALALALMIPAVQAQETQGTSPLSGRRGGTNNAFMQFTGPSSSLKSYALANASGTIALLNQIQTWSAAQSFNAAVSIASPSASAFAVGANGATNPVLSINASVASQADGLSITGTASGSGVALATTSPASNSLLTLSSKGTGGLFLQNAATGPINLGTATTLNGALTYGGVTLNNAVTGTGNMVLSTSPSLVTPTLGVALATSLQFSPSTGGIIGTGTNNNATGGVVGEYISSTVATGSAVALTTSTAANVTSISLTAGDWDVSAETYFNSPATTSFTTVLGSISTTTATLNQTAGFWDVKGFAAFVPGNNSGFVSCGVPFVRISVSGTTSVFLVAFATFTASTATAWGTIQARRVR